MPRKYINIKELEIRYNIFRQKYTYSKISQGVKVDIRNENGIYPRTIYS